MRYLSRFLGVASLIDLTLWFSCRERHEQISFSFCGYYIFARPDPVAYLGKFDWYISFLMRNYIGIFKAILATILALLFASACQQKELTHQEINAKECKKYIDSLFDKIAPDSVILRRDSVLSCMNEMDINLRDGLPNYVTHSPEAMQNYRKEKSKNELVDRREKNKETLVEIAGSCANSILLIYTSMYSKKVNGESKEQQLKYLQTGLAAAEPPTILDAILINLSYEALDDIYSKTGPANYSDAAKRVAVLHNRCKERYEQALSLRQSD